MTAAGEVRDLISLILDVLSWGTPLLFLLIIAYVLLFPEKAQKLSAALWWMISKVARFAHRKYVANDLEGRVNDFTRSLARDIPGFQHMGVKVEWVEPGINRNAFVRDGKVILRLRREDDNIENFVHGSFLFVRATVIRRAKRYLRPEQRDGVHLFVASRMLRKEKRDAQEFFLDEYLKPHEAPTTGGVTAASYYDEFEELDGARLFFPVLMQELDFIGSRVFGKRTQTLLANDLDGLIKFLLPIAKRFVGDENDMEYIGDVSRCAMMIIGKSYKVSDEGTQPYINYIKKQLIPKDIDCLYILGKYDNRDFIDAIWKEVCPPYEKITQQKYTTYLRFRNRGEEVPTLQYLVMLRRRADSHPDPVEAPARVPPKGTKSSR